MLTVLRSATKHWSKWTLNVGAVGGCCVEREREGGKEVSSSLHPALHTHLSHTVPILSQCSSHAPFSWSLSNKHTSRLKKSMSSLSSWYTTGTNLKEYNMAVTSHTHNSCRKRSDRQIDSPHLLVREKSSHNLTNQRATFGY